MPLLTQRNVVYIFAAQVGWGVFLASGILPHDKWVDGVTVGFNAATATLAFLGFNRTPNGNTLPPEVVHNIDRQATVAKAGDAIVETVAQHAVDEVKKPPEDAKPPR